MASEATNSTASRWGQTWTLSTGVDLTSWIEPGLDHGEQALGVAGRTGGRGRRRGGGDRGRTGGGQRADPAAALGLGGAGGLAGLGRLRALEQVRGDLAVGRGRLGRRVGRGRSAGAAASPPSPAALAASAFWRAASARLRRCSGISVMASQQSI